MGELTDDDSATLGALLARYDACFGTEPHEQASVDEFVALRPASSPALRDHVRELGTFQPLKTTRPAVGNPSPKTSSPVAEPAKRKRRLGEGRGAS